MPAVVPTAALIAAMAVAGNAGAAERGNWPQFRGPRGDGNAAPARPPLRWSETENIKWKTPIHDRGWSSPVIWDGQVWLTTATADGRQLFAVCLDRDSGRIVHDVKVLDVARPQKVSKVNSYASPTPVVEGGRLYAHYGTHGTVCLDTADGKVLWRRTDLTCDHDEGPGSSVILHGDLLVFNVDGCDVQYMVALDKSTGRTVWRADRGVDFGRAPRQCRKAFSTPTVAEAAGRKELLSIGARVIVGCDAASGKELWRVRHGGWSITPRPVCGGGLAFFVTDYDRPELWAVRPGGAGDVTGTHVAWKIGRGRGVPSTPSLLLAGEMLFAVSDKGTVSCVRAADGKVIRQEQLGSGSYFASPILADGRIYAFTDRGTCTVLRADATCRTEAVNSLAGRVMASPAAVGRALFVRTETHMYRIDE